jgi:hypothetical protein
MFGEKRSKGTGPLAGDRPDEAYAARLLAHLDALQAEANRIIELLQSSDAERSCAFDRKGSTRTSGGSEDHNLAMHKGAKPEQQEVETPSKTACCQACEAIPCEAIPCEAIPCEAIVLNH